jgi:hypothetical protein
MRPEYERYFRDLTDYDIEFRSSRGFSFGRPIEPFARGGYYPRSLVVNLLELIPENWRSDARFYLANNMIEMVLEPYARVSQRPAALMPDGDVWPLITDDIKQIVDQAEKIALQRDRQYVSATSVAIALGKLAENLKTTSLQIWGPGDEEE